MKYKIFKETENGKILWGVVEDESIAILITHAIWVTYDQKIIYEACEDVDEDELKNIAEESWNSLRKFASAPHVVDGWNNYIYGFEQGYRKAKEE